MTAGAGGGLAATTRAPYLWARERWRDLLLRRTRRRMAGPKLLRAFADAYPEAFFIEVGANDGEQSDHLRPFILSRAWRGIMIEPLPHVFERLTANYEGLDRVTLENAAIAAADGAMPFYHVAPIAGEEGGSVPGWYDTIGSFSRETVLRHAVHIPDLDQRIVQTQVPCLTFESLCRKHGVERIDLVLVDAEGYDYEIVKQIDLATYRPRLLIYEHYLLAPGERSACRARVERAGYSTMEEGFDTWCLDTGSDDSVTRTWRRLRPALPGFVMEELHTWTGAGEGEPAK
jgi:FkbM family methyltransferase